MSANACEHTHACLNTQLLQCMHHDIDWNRAMHVQACTGHLRKRMLPATRR